MTDVNLLYYTTHLSDSIEGDFNFVCIPSSAMVVIGQRYVTLDSHGRTLRSKGSLVGIPV